MLKKPASVVLASFRPSTYPRGCASALHSLRPCWTAFLSTLQDLYLMVDGKGTLSMPDIPPWVFRSCLGGVMRIFSRSMTATLSMGLIGLAIAPLLHAQEYPADITRGKAVYQRNCQGCHGVGGWGDGPDAKNLKVAPANFHRFASFLKSDEELLRTIEHGSRLQPHAFMARPTHGRRNAGRGGVHSSVGPTGALAALLSEHCIIDMTVVER